MSTVDVRTASVPPAPVVRLDPVATGTALMCTLVGLFLLCELATLVWPTAGLANGWVRLFASDPENVLRTLVEGVLSSVAGAWVSAAIFVPIYNRLARR